MNSNDTLLHFINDDAINISNPSTKFIVYSTRDVSYHNPVIK